MEPPERIAISLAEAAERIGVSESLAYRMARQGKFPGCFRLGGRWLVHIDTFRRETAKEASLWQTPYRDR
jgi:excisionase family DNA binding protein